MLRRFFKILNIAVRIKILNNYQLLNLTFHTQHFDFIIIFKVSYLFVRFLLYYIIYITTVSDYLVSSKSYINHQVLNIPKNIRDITEITMTTQPSNPRILALFDVDGTLTLPRYLLLIYFTI